MVTINTVEEQLELKLETQTEERLTKLELQVLELFKRCNDLLELAEMSSQQHRSMLYELSRLEARMPGQGELDLTQH